MIGRRRAFALAFVASALCANPAAAANRHAEAAAKAALSHAADDYLAMNYAAAAAKLQKAVRTCGPSKCAPATRAALLRDLGVMQYSNGDVGEADGSWAEALKLKPDIDLDPNYDTPKVRAAWETIRSKAGGGGASQPSGDFTHTPAVEQRVGTPLPVFVETRGATVARVVVKYKGAAASEWSRLQLQKMNGGWGGLIPCGDVTRGTMRYWIQGFDDEGDPTASSGDPKHPFTVPIRDDITSEAPHLPNRGAPRKCGDNDTGEAAASTGGEPSETTHEEEAVPSAPSGPAPFARFWIGISGVTPEFAQMGGTALCKLTSNTTPYNSGGYYCTNPNGTDFPSRQSSTQNDNLQDPNNAGNVSNGIRIGNVRMLAAFDYALSPSLLVGARLGYVLNSYQGQAAVSAGKAFGSAIDAEARATYLLGDAPLTHAGFAPMIFGGAGIAEVDVHASSTVVLANLGTYPVNVWKTDGPFFLEAGAGFRYQFSPRVAFTLAARLNAAIGGNGFLATYGPELGAFYGF